MPIRKFWETYAVQEGDFGAMCRELLDRIPAAQRVASLVFYGSPKGAATATGIGIQAGAVIVRIEAVEAHSPEVKNEAINNTLQVPAHRYSAAVLAGLDKILYAPRFERARLLGRDGKETIFFSGTAAIRGENSVTGTDAAEQTRITLENMVNLYPGRAIPVFDILIVYLKYARDYGTVKAIIDQQAEALSVVFVEADMCREELLVEIEGVAHNS